MKKLFIATLTVMLSFQSFASETCREKLEEKLTLRHAIGAVNTGVGGIATANILVGTAAATSPVLLPIFGGLTIAGGTYWIISTRKPTRLLKLIDQAQTCRGNLVVKAYRAYEKTHPENQRLTKEEFCSDIIQGNLDGSLCPRGSVPSIKNVGKYYID